MKLYIAILLFIQFLAIFGLALPTENPSLGITEKFEERILSVERIIDDQVYTRGVPLDFTYNETATSDFPSAPGCPKSQAGIPWVHFGSPKKCYVAGTIGSCNSYETLFVELGSHIGICSCSCLENIAGLTSGKMHFCSSRGLDFVFDPEFRKCFQLHLQGPCKENEWLVKVKKDIYTESDFIVRCESRTCPEGQRPNFFFEDSCKEFPVESSGAVASITPEDCKDGLKYNDVLRICAKQPPGIFTTS